MLQLTIAALVIILIAARKPLGRAAKSLVKRAAKALWKRLTVKVFGHCRTCKAPAVPFHTCIVKSSRPAAKSGSAKGIMAGREKRAERNGWIAPKPKLTQILVSQECAGGECAICPGEGCECSCNHNPVVIIARNEALYDARTDKVPF